jgi:DNA-binding XRE family transcriptional regulator/predicted nucleotidyltransferase
MTDILDTAGKPLGDSVREGRRHAGLTQSGLAAACGLSRQTIAQLEAGTFPDLGIRKIQRVLVQIGLRLRVEPAARTRARTRIAGLLRDRAEARRRFATRLAESTLRKLRKAGVAARVVGSLAKGTFHARSDVDFLVEKRGPLSESDIASIIESSMTGFPFDVVFADRVDPTLLELMLREAKLGASAIRAS